MSPLGRVHLFVSLVAIVAGGWVFFLPKGTRWHRTIGHVYVWSMAGVMITAFSIYGRTGHWGPFHWAAVVGTVTLAAGLYAVLRRRPKKSWIEAHAAWMAWSYVGLMAAFAAESATHFLMPKLRPFLEGRELVGAFWSAVGIASFCVAGLGWWLIKTRLPAAVDAAPAAMRRERSELRSADADTPA